MIKRHEGFYDKLYLCPAGHRTIGYGHNCDAYLDAPKYEGRLITETEATNLLLNDLSDCIKDCTKFIRSYPTYSDIEQCIILDMCFNLGIQGLLKFKKMLSAFNLKDHRTTAREMINSHWASQVGKRTTELVFMVFSQEFLC
jgi:lysozyme